jgi:hypothetical protein
MTAIVVTSHVVQSYSKLAFAEVATVGDEILGSELEKKKIKVRWRRNNKLGSECWIDMALVGES